MTGRSPDQLLLISSMDVDIAVKRVAVLRIEPLQPEDATQDEITSPPRVAITPVGSRPWKLIQTGAFPPNFA
jgi:hypothetical protein